MNERIERTTLKNLIHNEEYSRKVLPFIKEDYFSNRLEKILFSEIFKFTTQYNKLPTRETLEIDIQNRRDITDEEYKQIVALIQSLKPKTSLTALHFSSDPAMPMTFTPWICAI